MRTVTLTLLLAFFLGGNLTFAQEDRPVAWAFEHKEVSTGEYELVFTATMDKDWSIYSQFLDEGGPIPTIFTFDEGSHELVGEVAEAAEKPTDRVAGFDKIFEMDVVKYFNKAIFTQRVKVDGNATISGYLEYMACDKEQCLPPTEVDFSFEVGSKAAVDDSMPVAWSFDSKEVGEGEYDLTFTADIADKWAVYSQFIEEGGPIPTSFVIDEGEHFEAVGKVEESEKNRKTTDDPVFEMELTKFYKQAVFTQRVKVSDESKPITGYLEFMTCDDEQCLPPTEVDFSFALSGESASGAVPPTASDNTNSETFAADPTTKYGFDNKDAGICGDDAPPAEEEGASWLTIFLLGFGGGLLALLTPCVFPMIPLTVGFFTKSSKDRSTGIRNAVIYGLSIIVIYVSLGLLITSIFGADALNLLSTDATFNIIFAVLFFIFALSFFGLFEIQLPSSWANRTEALSDKGGLIGIFFMAFTLSLVSFSCTGPIIGTLLVETATGGGPTILGRIPAGPLVGMLGFSTALALPFALFAAFPSWLNSLPKSGGWMSDVKVTLGFLEVAFALKFLSVADLTMGWKILPYEAFLAVWVLCALGLALYFFGLIKFPVNYTMPKRTPKRMAIGGIALLIGAYFAMGFQFNDVSKTFTTPPILSGLAPPAGHSYIYPKECPLNLDCFKDYDKGLAYAQKVNKPVLLDFTGHGCVNCRKMEDQVWSQDGVFDIIKDNYVLISLYVDERKELEKPYKSEFYDRPRTKVGNKWADFQRRHFDRQSQPYYVLIDPKESGSTTVEVLNTPVAYTPDERAYQEFLECGLERFKLSKRVGQK